LASKRKKLLILFIKLSISGSILYFVLKKAGIEEVFSTIGGMAPVCFFGAMLLYIVTVYTSSHRWKYLLSLVDGSSGLSSFRLFALYLMGAFFSRLLPGMVGGDAVRAYYLYKDTKSGTMALASVLADRYIGFAAMLSLGLIALPFGISKISGADAGWAIPLEWIIPLIAITFITVSFIIFTLKIGSRFSKVKDFYEYFLKLKNSPSILLKSFGLSIIVQVIGIFAVYLISVGIGAKTSLVEFFLFVPIINTITALPISMSGLGVREGAFVLLLGLTGIKPEVATSISLAWFLSYALGSTPGIIVYLKWRVQKQESEDKPIPKV